MKKIFAIVLGLGLILFTSCQHKELEQNTYAGEGNVTLTICASDALQTRAALELNSNLGGISNVDRAAYYLRYKLAVYLDGELVIEPQTQMSNAFAGVTYSLQLVEGDTYTIVCWADFVKDSSGDTDLHYDTSDLTAITCLDAADAQLNDESRDAFFAAQEITVDEENASASITLRRPFAKLRIVTTDWDENGTGMPDAIDIDYYDCTRFTSLNALTGAVTGETLSSAQTYSAAIDVANKAYDGGYDAIEGYRTLVVDYLLAESEVSAIHLSYETYRNSVETHTYDIVEDIPIERNYITTIIGDLLTTNDNITISIDEDFEGEYTYELGKFTSDATETYEYDGTNYPVVYIGSTVTLTPSITATSWTWTSSDETIATVSDGVVTGVAEGLVTITARCTTDDGVQVCSGKFYVMAEDGSQEEPDEPEETVAGGVSVEETSLTLPIDKGTYTVSYSEPDDASQTLSWASSNTDVVTVSGNVITVVGFGSATVTVSSDADEIDEDNGYAASAEIAVSVPKGYYNEDCSGSDFHWAGHKTQVASLVKNTNATTGESYYTVTANNSQAPNLGYKTTGTGDYEQGDLDFYIDPINYPIVCIRFEDLALENNWFRAITLDTIGYAESDTDKETRIAGSVGNGSDKWLSDYSKTCSDNTRIAVYDLSTQAIGASTMLTETTVFSTTWQIKYADICTSSNKDSNYAKTDASWDFYWFKTFKSYDELNSFLSEWSAATGITY